MSEPQVQALLARIEDFLRITNRLVAFDHLSLVQWFTEENDDGFPLAGPYAVPQENAQERLTAWARAEIAAGQAHARPYLTRHLAAHLEPNERQAAYHRLLMDLRWLEPRLRWADLNALLSDWRWIAPTLEHSAVERALRQGAHVLSHQGQGWTGLVQLPSQLLARRPRGEAPGLRDQAIARLQTAGGPQPLTDSLLGSKALLRTLTGHGTTLNVLAVLPNGRLASGANDATIKLWDPATGEPGSSQLLFVADGGILALAFLPAASILVAGDASGRLHRLQLGVP